MKQKIYWKTYVGLGFLALSYYFNFMSFFFAIFFLIWSIQGIKSGQAFFIELISRNEKPFLFWLISILWLALSLWSLLYSDTVLTWLYDAFGIYWNYGN